MMSLLKMFSPALIADGFRDWPTAPKIWLAIAVSMILSISLYWGESLIGIVSAVTGVICVVLVARGKIANYSFGLVNVVLYGWVAYQATYYGDAMLNWMFYLPLQFIGFYMWNKDQNKEDSATVKRKSLEVSEFTLILVLSCCVILVYAMILDYFGDAMPTVDAATTVLSIVAMILMVYRYSEQWLLWIVVNVFSIGMWAVHTMSGDGGGIAALMMWMVFLVNSIYGAVNWYRNSELTHA